MRVFRPLRPLAVLAALAVLTGGAGADPLAIATPADLQAALTAPQPGQILLLAPGDYGALTLRQAGGGPDAALVLRSADPAHPARFSGLMLRDVRDLRLEGLVFDYVFRPGDALTLRPFQIITSQDVTITGAVFDGDLARGLSPVDDGFGTGFGLTIQGSAAVTLADSEIRRFYRGLVVSQSSGVTIRGNDVHAIRSDGMDFAEVRQVRIEGNYIHDFDRALLSKDHADMIQFWTNGTKTPTEDVVIRSNLLASGSGWYTQSIFMRNDQVDRGLAGPEMFYRNIVIDNNAIINAHLHGITVGATAGLTITRNTVARNAASQGAARNVALWVPQIRVSNLATGVRIAGNAMSKIDGYGRQPDWSVSGNLEISDSWGSTPGYYDKIFMAARSAPQLLASYAYRPGGPLDGTGIGSTLLAGPAVAPAPQR